MAKRRPAGRPPTEVDRSTKRGQLAARIRRARLKKGLSVAEAAQKLGVAPGSWYNWECGRRSPAAELIGSIARILGSSADSILPK